jgi:MFS family permease
VLDEGGADAAAILNQGRDETLRGWVIPAIIGMALMMQTLNATSINNALPSMAHALHVEPLRLNVAITMYLLASAVFLPISGWMADRFGAKIFMTPSCSTPGLRRCDSPTCRSVVYRLAQGCAGAGGPVGRLVSAAQGRLVGAMRW